MGGLGLVPARTMRATAADCLLPLSSQAIRKHLRDRGVGAGVAPEFLAKRNSQLVGIRDGAPTTPSVSGLAKSTSLMPGELAPAFMFARVWSLAAAWLRMSERSCLAPPARWLLRDEWSSPSMSAVGCRRSSQRRARPRSTRARARPGRTVVDRSHARPAGVVTFRQPALHIAGLHRHAPDDGESGPSHESAHAFMTTAVPPHRMWRAWACASSKGSRNHERRCCVAA
jgi:hypothetical protein